MKKVFCDRCKEKEITDNEVYLTCWSPHNNARTYSYSICEECWEKVRNLIAEVDKDA